MAVALSILLIHKYRQELKVSSHGVYYLLDIYIYIYWENKDNGHGVFPLSNISSEIHQSAIECIPYQSGLESSRTVAIGYIPYHTCHKSLRTVAIEYSCWSKWIPE